MSHRSSFPPEPGGTDYQENRGRRGFTLLELIISTVLMSVLLAGTWALLGIYQGQFEKSQDRVERWQLIRSLQNQLTDDLRACHVPASELEAGAPEAGAPEASAAEVGAAEVGAAEMGVPKAVVSRESSLDSTDLESPESDFVGPSGSSVLSEWMNPVVGLEGSNDTLILDVLAPTHPGDAGAGPGPTPGDQAVRVVYAFVDPSSAVAEGRPAGFIRCQWKAQELQSLYATQGGEVDFYALVHQIKSPRPQPSSMGRSGESATDDEVRSAAMTRPLVLGFDTVDIRMMEEDVIQRIDVVPELSSLVLSYYDGTQWQSSWSFSRRRALPVAVEMRFDLATPSSTKPLQEADPSAAAQRALRERNQRQAVPPRPTDDRIRSSQVAPPVGYRWLVYLGGRNQGRDLQPVEEDYASRDSMP